MPKADEQTLRSMLEEIYVRQGVPAEEASVVARHQVESNLVGHDSHGVSQTIRYVERIKKGHLMPGAKLEIDRESASTAAINGNWGFGFTTMEAALEIAAGKAALTGVGAVTVRQQGHVGRLGAYAAMAADRGLASVIMADSGLGPKYVAPYGGRAPRLGTNPLCLGAPGAHGATILDFATSAVALGKVIAAGRRGEQIPTGWVIDADGADTTDPAAYAQGGALLPLGGDQAHKGYGLSFMVEVFCGLLTGLGFGIDPEGRHNDGVFMAVFDVEAFAPLGGFTSMSGDFVDYLRATPLAAGFSEILYPGELEARTAEARRAGGVQVDDLTWAELNALLEQPGQTEPDPRPKE